MLLSVLALLVLLSVQATLLPLPLYVCSLSFLPPASSWKCQAWNERTTAAVLFFSLELCSLSLSISWSPPSSWGWEEREKLLERGKLFHDSSDSCRELRERSKRVSVRKPTSHPSYPDSNLLFILFLSKPEWWRKKARVLWSCVNGSTTWIVFYPPLSPTLSLLNFSLSNSLPLSSS